MAWNTPQNLISGTWQSWITHTSINQLHQWPWYYAQTSIVLAVSLYWWSLYFMTRRKQAAFDNSMKPWPLGREQSRKPLFLRRICFRKLCCLLWTEKTLLSLSFDFDSNFQYIKDYKNVRFLSRSSDDESLCSSTLDLHKFYLSPLLEVPYLGALQHLGKKRPERPCCWRLRQMRCSASVHSHQIPGPIRQWVHILFVQPFTTNEVI